MPSRRNSIELSAEETRSYLDSRKTLIIVSNGKDGYPHTMPMWFAVNDDGTIDCTTFGKSQKVLNYQRDPKVLSLVLSSTPLVDEALRRSRREHPGIDLVAPSTDGSHLMQQWGKHEPFYPTDRPDLLAAYVLDASRVAGKAEAGPRRVATYRMEERIARVHQPALIVRATADPYVAPHDFEPAAQLPQARVVDIDGGMVPLPDQMPQAFAKVVLDFLSAQAQRRLHRKPPMRRPARMQAVSTGARDDSS